MTVEVRLFANLARYLPPGARGGAAMLELPDAATVADAVQRLAIPAELPGLLLVNGVEATPAQPLRTGDVLSIVPPLAGGTAPARSTSRADVPAATPRPRDRGGPPVGGRLPAWACRAAAVVLGIVAVGMAAWSRPVVFDLRADRYADAVALFETSRAVVDIDGLAAGARVPYVLPGPADEWAGGQAHALRIRAAGSAAAGLRLELYTVESHETAPPRLRIEADGWVARLQLEAGTGAPPPHQDRGRRRVYVVPVPGRERPGPWVLTVANEAGAWVMWQRIRLVEAPATAAPAHLGLEEPLPWPSAALLTASLVALGIAAFLGGRPRGATAAFLGLAGPVTALALAGTLLAAARHGWLPFQPRWLTLAVPWCFVAIVAWLARRPPRAATPGAAGTGAVLDLGLALAATHLGILLLNGGYRATVAGVGVRSPRLAAAVIVLVMLAVFRLLHRVGVGVVQRHPGAFLLAAVLVVYLANGRTITSWDTRPARYLPFSVLREADFDLDEFLRPGEVPPGYFRAVGGRYVSGYPVGVSLLALPFYVPAAAGGLDPDSAAGDELEKLAATTLIALSALLLHAAVRRVSDGPTALIVALVYALGTSSLSASSQALWQHTAAQPALVAALYAFVRARAAPAWLTLAGFAAAFAVVARPANLLLTAPLALYALAHHRRAAWRFVLGALLPAGFQGWYDLAYFGELFHAHLPAGYSPWRADAWNAPLLAGLAGVLFSPGRGLFVYSPVFLFSAVGLALAWRRGGDPLLRYLGIGSVLLVGLYAKWRLWHGGPVFGPRLLADLAPLLAFALWPLREWGRRRRPLAVLFAAAVGCSVGAHSIGAFYDDWRWTHCSAYEVLHDRLWTWRDNQLVAPLKRALVAVWKPPTSDTDPGLLAARYDAATTGPLAVEPSAALRLTVTAHNAGQAVWRAAIDAPERGVVLRWGWHRQPAGHVRAGGQALLCSDTFPGEAAEFHLLAPAPGEAAAYVLEVALTSGATSFEEAGTPPLRLAVDVRATVGDPR